MRLSVASKLKVLKPDKSGFPTVLKSDYAITWPEFLKTKIVADIKKQYKSDSVFYYTLAFCSMIRSLDSKCWASKSVNIGQMTSFDFSPNLDEISSFIRRKFPNTRLIKSGTDLRYTDNDYISAVVDPVVEGWFTLAPKSGTLDQYMHSVLVPTTFRDVPIEYTYKKRDLRAQLDSQVGWIHMLKSESSSISVTFLRTNMILVRYSAVCKGIGVYVKSPNKLLASIREQNKMVGKI